MVEKKAICFSCGKEVSLGLSGHVARSDVCEFCSVDLHSCKMCLNFDIHVYNECHEPNAERVMDKEKSNFCEYFDVNTDAESSHKKREKFLSAAEALFKNK